MDDIRICAEAWAIIGENEKWRPGGGRYECLRCGEPGLSTAPTSLVLMVYRQSGHSAVDWAHAECVPSVVMHARGRLVTAASGDPDEDLVRVRPVIMNGGPGRQPWPVLLHEFVRAGQPVPPQSADQDVADLLADGLTRLADGDSLAGLAQRSGWRLELRGSGARLAAPSGTVYYQGPWNAAAEWEELASQRRGCLLVSGIVGLYQWQAMSAPARTLSRRLDEAARAGTVAGGLMPVVRG